MNYGLRPLVERKPSEDIREGPWPVCLLNELVDVVCQASVKTSVTSQRVQRALNPDPQQRALNPEPESPKL